MSEYIAIIGMFFITLLSRVGFMFLPKILKLSLNWQYILRLTPAVTLASAILLDTFFYKHNFLGFINNFRLGAVLASIICFVCFKKIWLSLLCGIGLWFIFIYFNLIQPIS